MSSFGVDLESDLEREWLGERRLAKCPGRGLGSGVRLERSLERAMESDMESGLERGLENSLKFYSESGLESFSQNVLGIGL